MPRAVANKTYRTFVKGLITEASPLTYPENSSLDEDNMILYRRGNRSRRLGFDFEDEYELNDVNLDAEDFNNVAYHEYRWETVSNIGTLNFLVQQIGLKLYFYNMSADPLSSGLKSFTVNLNSYTVPGAITPELCQVSMVAGKGILFVSGALFEPFYVQYDVNTDTVSTKQIYIQIRDFKGISDGLSNDEEPASLSNEHHYNLRNQGWVDSGQTSSSIGSVSYFDQFGNLSSYNGPSSKPITDYFGEFRRYPPNSKQWWVGKNSDNQSFSPVRLSRIFTGNNRAPRGHFIVNAFYVDRSSMSGVSGIPVESETERPPTISFFSGRVWYGLNGTIYYSQILDDKSKAGFCYQAADPTSEEISDLVASDGGVIPIPEMGKVVRLFPAGAGMMVFATNGIWFIGGTTAGFNATDISVSKVGPIGTESPNSVVEAEGQIFWWSKVGIMAMNPKSGLFGPIDGQFDKLNISETTIQTFYNENIPEDAKPYVKGVYDPALNTVQWIYRDDTVANLYEYNRVLNFDISLTAFYPWSVSESSPRIIGIFPTPRLNEITTELSVIDSLGRTVVDAGSDTVTIERISAQAKKSFIKYVVAVPDSGEYKMTFGLFNNTNYCDWETYTGTGVSYNSYIETGYELLDDLMRKKQAPFVFTYFRKTEENFVEVGDTGVWDVDKPSSCYFQTKWDWSDSGNSGKWSSKVQSYRHRRVPTLNEADPVFDNGFAVVVTRHKVRGTGRALQFRFECDEIGKDFDLLGWAAKIQGNTEV